MYTAEQIAKAVADHAKRLQYNKAWRERNPERAKAIRQAYNKKRWAAQKEMLAIAKTQGQI